MAGKTHANVRLSAAIDGYLRRIENEGQANASQITARYALHRFQRAVASGQDRDPYLHLISATDVDTYFFGPTGVRRGIGARAFNRYRSVLKVFFDYGILMRWVDTNPMDSVARARPDMPKQRLLLSASEMQTMLEAARNPIGRIALSLAMNTGLRSHDLTRLTVFDASLSTGTLQTEIRKTRKLDVKPITMELHRELVRWLDIYAELMHLDGREQLPNDWLLIPSYRVLSWAPQPLQLKPLQPHTNPWRLVQYPLARIGYPTKGEGFHTLRRSSARALFEMLREDGAGRDHALMIVKEFLNHSSTVQTEHYLGLERERTIRDSILKDQPFLSRLVEVEQARANENQNTATPLHAAGGI